MIKGIYLYSIPVRDLNKATEFYTKTLGAGRKVGEVPGAFVIVETDGKRYWLVSDKMPTSPKAGRDGGVVFLVDSLEKTVNSLKEAGCTPDGPILETPSGAKQVSYRDPDGNVFALFQEP